jgi:hypothetical protein
MARWHPRRVGKGSDCAVGKGSDDTSQCGGGMVKLWTPTIRSYRVVDIYIGTS